MKNIVIFLILILFGACSGREVEPGIMSKTYIDLLIAKETYPRGSEKLEEECSKVFAKYNISSEDYYFTLKNYQADQKKWDEFFKQSREYLDSLKVLNKSN